MSICSLTHALPQFSLLTGNRCINCHINVQGGGIRNELGWYSMESVGVLQYEDIGLRQLKPILSSNTLLDGKVTLGVDFRFQSSRSLRDTSRERRFFPMQGAFYTAYQPVNWFYIEAQYNVGRRTYSYAGQQAWSASINVQPTLDYPQLRVGFFQPSIGYRFDDHTMLIRRVPAGSYDYLLAPNWAEWGAELNYIRFEWLTVTVGVSSLGNLQNARVTDSEGAQRPLINRPSELAVIGRVLLSPQLYRDRLSVNIGASTLRHRDFLLWNAFGGIGYADLVWCLIETMQQESPGLRGIRATSAEVGVHLFEPVYFYARAERGQTTVGILTLRQEQFLLGAQIFVLPYVELRPEYRIVDLPLYRLGRWTVQLHMFY